MEINFSLHAAIASYQIFAYQERPDQLTVNESLWKRLGDVKPLLLPMACTLTHVTFKKQSSSKRLTLSNS